MGEAELRRCAEKGVSYSDTRDAGSSCGFGHGLGHRRADALVERLTALVISDDVEAVKAGIEALTKGTETLAERRMDRSIREALSGMSVDDEMFDEKPEDESKNH